MGGLTIPEDIMRAARTVYDDALADGFRAGSVATIARAILAERQRCADVAYLAAMDGKTALQAWRDINLT
ncbi:hypothetical protein D3C71_2007270 [compost metagenome]